MEDPAKVAAEVGQGREEAVHPDVHAQHVLQVTRKVATGMGYVNRGGSVLWISFHQASRCS